MIETVEGQGESCRRFLGLDVGGTKLHGVLIDASGKVHRRATIPTLASEGSEAIMDRICILTRQLLQENNAEVIGIGAPGPLDLKSGTILKTENLPFENLHIASILEHRFSVPTYLENDGAAAAFGEYLFGPAQGADPLLYLTVSTGIGAGLVVDGKLYHGKTGNALEVGHIPLLAGEGTSCTCGGRGCLEALASGSAIAEQAKRSAEAARLGHGEMTLLANYMRPGPIETFALASQGDNVASRITTKALHYLGQGAVILVTIFDPEVLVVGGGLVKSGNDVKAAITTAIANHPMTSTSPCRIIVPGIGDDAGALGAAALAARELLGTELVHIYCST